MNLRTSSNRPYLYQSFFLPRPFRWEIVVFYYRRQTVSSGFLYTLRTQHQKKHNSPQRQTFSEAMQRAVLHRERSGRTVAVFRAFIILVVVAVVSCARSNRQLKATSASTLFHAVTAERVYTIGSLSANIATTFFTLWMTISVTYRATNILPTFLFQRNSVAFSLKSLILHYWITMDQSPKIEAFMQAAQVHQSELQNATNPIAAKKATLDKASVSYNLLQKESDSLRVSQPPSLKGSKIDNYPGKDFITSWVTHMDNFLASTSKRESRSQSVSDLSGAAHEWWISYKDTEDGKKVARWEALWSALLHRFPDAEQRKACTRWNGHMEAN